MEIHVNGKRAGPPDREGGDKSPHGMHIFPGEPEGNEQREKTVECGAKGHGVAVWPGKAVRRDTGTELPRHQHTRVGNEQERRPKQRWADGEMIIKMAGDSKVLEFRLSGIVETWSAKPS